MTDERPSPDGPDEFPTEAELPDEPVTVDDLDPFAVDDDEFEDIDDFAAAEWKQATTADERIRTVIEGTTVPKSAREIADTALVSETKARTTLNALAEDGIVHSHRTDAGKRYSRDPEWHLLKQIRHLAGSETLVDQLQRVQQELTTYTAKYDVTDPEELLISETELTQDELDDVSHWRTAKRAFNHLRVAYRFKEAIEQGATGTEPSNRHTGDRTTTLAGDQSPLQ